MPNQAALQELKRRFDAGNMNEQQEQQFRQILKKRIQQKQGPQIEGEPIELPQRVSAGGFLAPDQTGEEFKQGEQPRGVSDEEAALAERGIETREGAPASARFAASFAPNKTARADAIRQRLPEGSEVNIDPESGRIVFKTPDMDRFATVDEDRLELADFAEIAQGIPIIGEVVGATGGMAATRRPFAGGAGGAAAGRFTGEMLQRELGEALGVRDEPIEESLQKSGVEAAKALAFEAGAQGAGRGIAKGFTGIRRRLRGDADLTDARLNEILREATDSAPTVEEINQSQTNLRFRPSVGQQAGDEDVLNQQRTLASSQQELGRRQQAQQVESERALREAAENRLRREGPTTERGRGIQREVQRAEEDILNPARQAAQETEEQAVREVESLPVLDEPLFGSQGRSNLSRLREQAREKENQLFNRFREQVGFDQKTNTTNVKINVGGNNAIKRAVREIDQEAKTALLNRQAKQKEGLTQGVLGALVERGGPKKFDVQQINDTLSFLKRERRRISRSSEANEPLERDIDRLITGLQTTRNNQLARKAPEALKTLKKAEQATKQRAKTFDQGLVGRFFEERGGELRFDDAELFQQVVQSPSTARRFAGAIGSDPQANQLMRRALFGFYRKNVTPRGSNVPSRELHNEFMDRFGEQLKPFFSEDDFSRIQRLGNFSDVIKKQAKRLEALESRVGEIVPNLDRINPESIGRSVFRESVSVGDAEKLWKLLNNRAPRTLQDAKDLVSTEVARRVITDKGVNKNAIDKIVEDQGDKIRALMGPKEGKEFLRGLKMFKRAQEQIERKGRSLSKKRQPTVFDAVFRISAGVLSRAGLAKTKLDELQRASAQQAMFNALSDVDNLRGLMKKRDAEIGTENAAQVLSALGAPELNALVSGGLTDQTEDTEGRDQ